MNTLTNSKTMKCPRCLGVMRYYPGSYLSEDYYECISPSKCSMKYEVGMHPSLGKFHLIINNIYVQWHSDGTILFKNKNNGWFVVKKFDSLLSFDITEEKLKMYLTFS